MITFVKISVMKIFYYTIKVIFYLVATLSIVQLMTDYKADRKHKQEVKTELRNLVNGLR